MQKIFSFIVVICLAKLNGFSQTTQVIPFDSTVRFGHLNNGLTYYIRRNELPKDRAEFYIAQRVGSILEEESQRGLAHFLEHMCFNGTKNFPGNSLISELEAKGVRFGENINAYTSIDETVYNLSNIPVTRGGLIDTALLVLHDWSGFVLLEGKDIDDERGVIREEWRSRNTGNYRAMEATVRNIFPGSQYAERMPIGLIDVINNFPYQAIRDYYKKWYRPDLQAIIVVGDIDVDRVEEKIKALFSDIPAPLNPAVRVEFQVPDNAKPIVSIVTDPEVQQAEVAVFYKRNAVPDSLKNTTEYYAEVVINSLISAMFNQRLYELSQKSNPPFNGADGGLGNFYLAKSKSAWMVGASPRNNNDSKVALRAILTENERMRRFGFTMSEFERAKTNLLRGYESAYNERNKLKNGTYVDACVQHFINGEPNPGIEWEYRYVNSFLSDLSLNRVNGLVKTFVTDTNVVFVLTGPQKDDVALPSKDEILSVWNEVKNAEVEQYLEVTAEKGLIEKEPVSGKIVKSETKPFGYTQWTLSNGVKVFFKRTDLKKDQVIMSSYSLGGVSLVDDVDLPSAMVISNVAPLGGVGQLSLVELGKVLTGKMSSVSPFVGGLSEGIEGSASPKDVETMLQLTYLYFTQPRMDQSAFDNWKSKMRDQLKNASLNPINSLRDTLNKLRTNDNPYGKSFNLEMLDKVDYGKVMALYRQRFANAGDFTFFITGNVSADSIKGLVELYFGGLPSVKSRESFIDRGVYPKKGIVKNHFNMKLETPKSTVVAIYSGKISYSLKNIVLMDYLRSILDIVYTQSIREKEGGTYGVSVGGSVSKLPQERFTFSVQFDTDPVKRDRLMGLVYDEIKKIMKETLDDTDVQKVKSHMLKSHQEQIINNTCWAGAIRSMVVNGVDLHSDYERVVSSVTPAMIRDFAKKVFSQGNRIEVSMSPEEE